MDFSQEGFCEGAYAREGFVHSPICRVTLANVWLHAFVRND